MNTPLAIKWSQSACTDLAVRLAVPWFVRMTLVFVANFTVVLKIQAAEPRIVPVQRWSNVFGNEDITQQFRLRGGAVEGQAIGWRATLETAVIARRETAVQADAARPAAFARRVRKFWLPFPGLNRLSTSLASL